jgi:uncharacterized protein with NRDE domain
VKTIRLVSLCVRRAVSYTSVVCTLAIFLHRSRNLPLVVAANRDEFYERPTAAPRQLTAGPWAFGGQDLQAGGTWFGANEHHLIVGLLNRRHAGGPDPSRRSRGLLCLEALQRACVADVVAWMREQDPARYNAFSLLAADPERAAVVANDGSRMITCPLDPGLHVLTNTSLGDPTCARRARSVRVLDPIDIEGAPLENLVERLRWGLADHHGAEDADPLQALCVHTPRYGTRSSAVIAYSSRTNRLRYWHAEGPPCRSAYVEAILPSV